MRRPRLSVVPDLPKVQTRHLPVAWDGKPITWGNWEGDQTTFALHAPSEEWACHQCGGMHGHDTNRGTIKDASLTPRRLWALRCKTCGHDTITQRTSDGWATWDLDETDYGADGSWGTGQGRLP